MRNTFFLIICLLGASFTGCLDSLPLGEDDEEQTPSSLVSDIMNTMGKGDHSSFCNYKLGEYGYPLEEDAKNQYNINFIKAPRKNFYDIVLIAVAQNYFKIKNKKFLFQITKKNSLIFDLKNIFKNKFLSF